MVQIRNFQFTSTITAGAIRYNTETSSCINNRPTSAVVKCILTSGLQNLKTLSELKITSNTLAEGISTLRIDHDVSIPATILPTKLARFIHVEADVEITKTGSQNEIAIIDNSRVNNPNKVESIIPPSSCFNMTLTESIIPITIGFTATGLSGTITTNVIGSDTGDVSPCN